MTTIRLRRGNRRTGSQDWTWALGRWKWNQAVLAPIPSTPPDQFAQSLVHAMPGVGPGSGEPWTG